MNMKHKPFFPEDAGEEYDRELGRQISEAAKNLLDLVAQELCCNVDPMILHCHIYAITEAATKEVYKAMGIPGKHPDDIELSVYVAARHGRDEKENRRIAKRLDKIEAHLIGCEECRDTVGKALATLAEERREE